MSKAAVIQMLSSADVASNIQRAEHFIASASEQGAKLAVLPENFAFMGMHEVDKLSIDGDAIEQYMVTFARKYNIWLLAGTVPLKAKNNRVRAASLVFDDAGRCVARYDKIHLFDVRVSENEAHEESKTIEAGTEFSIVDTPVGKLGLSVCYDLRFPELYRQLVLEGAELFSVPSAFTAVTGAAHWEVLLRARAIENLCYVLAANQGGIHQNKRHTFGHSMIIEPWGKVLARHAGEGEGVVIAEIDLPRLHQLRRQFPCNEHHILTHKLKQELA